jgi:hypothetical protein
VNIGADRRCHRRFRRVVVLDPKDGRKIVLLTNHLGFGATTLTHIYRDRWKVELFFKALTQNLKVKSVVGTSENALNIQIWTAPGPSDPQVAPLPLPRRLVALQPRRLLQLNLFTYRDVMTWLDDLYETPPLIPQPVQLALELGRLRLERACLMASFITSSSTTGWPTFGSSWRPRLSRTASSSFLRDRGTHYALGVDFGFPHPSRKEVGVGGRSARWPDARGEIAEWKEKGQVQRYESIGRAAV